MTLDFMNTPYTLSSNNRLTMIGCSDLSLLEGRSGKYQSSVNFSSGCVSLCPEEDQTGAVSCPGNGCCQLTVPKRTVTLTASILGLEDRFGNAKSKPCSYSFLGEQDSFVLQDISDLYRPQFSFEDWLSTISLTLDWRIGTGSCEEARRSSTCKENSICIDADHDGVVRGYRCGCLPGYEGNPYLLPGCQDIDDCKSYPCHVKGICSNTPGSYICSCPPGYTGDGLRDGKGCLGLLEANSKETSRAAVATAIVMLFVAGLLVSLLVYVLVRKSVKKKTKEKLKQKFFKQNGGLLLQQQMLANENLLGKTITFTAKELEKATDHFNENRILGRGGQGIVYKGMLSDGKIVAIKKSQLLDENKSKHLVEQFINEVVILSEINHKHIVKLLGCCLETKIPLLVYEFMSNGTLYGMIHNKNPEFLISWNMRLKIALDVAGALAYLHSATSVPIFHRDVKSSNILLDEMFVAKVSDFGTSKFVEVDQTHLTTKVNGTFGYIDPEYFQSSQLTEKSDVYSFGVVLVELLTGLKPIIASINDEDDISLVSRFLSKMKEDNLDSILENQMEMKGEKKDVLVVANLARRCLNLNGKKRPTMKEVVMELEGVRISIVESNVKTKLPEYSSFGKSQSNDYSSTHSFEIGSSLTV